MSITTLLNNSELFVEKSLQFQSENINTEQIPLPITDAKFGILKLNAVSVPVSQCEQEFIFMIDCSGSMSDMCYDGRNKMQHIVHTLKNMILYFKENSNIKVNITIHAFDDNIYKIVDRTEINSDNIDETEIKNLDYDDLMHSLLLLKENDFESFNAFLECYL